MLGVWISEWASPEVLHDLTWEFEGELRGTVRRSETRNCGSYEREKPTWNSPSTCLSMLHMKLIQAAKPSVCLHDNLTQLI